MRQKNPLRRQQSESESPSVASSGPHDDFVDDDFLVWEQDMISVSDGVSDDVYYKLV